MLDNLLFKKESGENIENIIEYAKAQILNDKFLSVIVGCDSQNRRYSTMYVTVIAFVFEGKKGAHYIYVRDNVKKIKDRYQRLWGEVQRSTDLALEIERHGLKVFRVDLDFNEKEIARSSDMVKAARGYVIGSGFDCEVKPGALIASRAADHLVRQ